MTDDRVKKNEVFNPPPVDPKGVPVVTSADRVRAEFGLDIPIETVPLPSNGVCYPVGSPLHLMESVDIYGMTTREEDILTNQSLLKRGTVITELIKSCLANKAADPASLLVGDRNALMVAIRITGYGEIYPAEVKCGSDSCEHEWKHEFNLLHLPIKRLELSPVEVGRNLFEFKLPRSNALVRFRFLTGRDEEEISATSEKQKKLGLAAGASNVSTSLMYSIVSVNGIEDRSKLSLFIKHMSAGDSLALRDYIKSNEPGITMKQQVRCPDCNLEQEMVVPLGVTFFWPNAKSQD